jgi:putative hydrolase of HD superfamily
MQKENDIQKILDFLKEARKLQNTYRFTLQPEGRYENDAEHSWAVALTCMLLTSRLEEEFDTKLDRERILKMALIHDLAEIHTGDTKTWDKKSRIGKEEKEREAIHILINDLPEDTHREILSLWEECEAQETLEAKIVKSIDRMDPVIHRTSFDAGWKNVEGVKGAGTKDTLDAYQYPRHEFSKTLTELYETVRDEAIAKGMLKKNG